MGDPTDAVRLDRDSHHARIVDPVRKSQPGPLDDA
jgi:hypothetical protein